MLPAVTKGKKKKRPAEQGDKQFSTTPDLWNRQSDPCGVEVTNILAVSVNTSLSSTARKPATAMYQI